MGVESIKSQFYNFAGQRSSKSPFFRVSEFCFVGI
jgi:hypothetical protein